MSLYHSYDKQFRLLQESWKQVQEEEEYGDSLRNSESNYSERPGLEGPFKMHNGKTYYYDPKEGKYYDPTTDWYVESDSEEFYQLTGMKNMGESSGGDVSSDMYEEFETAENVKEQIESSIDAPFVRVKTSTLSRIPSHAIYISLDPKETWSGRIYENSNYFTFMIHEDSGSLELLSRGVRSPIKFRKSRVKNIQQAIDKINSYIQQVKSNGQEA